MYYLQSRYYNPEWGRFINADAIVGQVGELLSHNVFAYCKNNPVNRQDSSGFTSIRNDFTDPNEITVAEDNVINTVSVQSTNSTLTTIGKSGQRMKVEASCELKHPFNTAKSMVQNNASYALSGIAINFGLNIATANLSDKYKLNKNKSIALSTAVTTGVVIIDTYAAERTINAVLGIPIVYAKNSIKYMSGEVIYRFDKATLNPETFKNFCPRGFDY